jgi:hypothetical protein
MGWGNTPSTLPAFRAVEAPGRLIITVPCPVFPAVSSGRSQEKNRQQTAKSTAQILQKICKLKNRLNFLIFHLFIRHIMGFSACKCTHKFKGFGENSYKIRVFFFPLKLRPFYVEIDAWAIHCW